MSSTKGDHHFTLKSEEQQCWPERLTSSLAKMQQSGTLCDLVLACKDGSVLAHSNVLASVSSVVEEICQNSNNNRTFQLPNISHHTMAAVIHFAYFGECSVPQEQLIDLGLAASHLKITSLAQSCDARLKEIPKKVNKNNKFIKTEMKDQSSKSSVVIEEKEDESNNSVTLNSPRKSSRKRKTSQKLIEAISDSRPRAKRRVLNKEEGRNVSESSADDSPLKTSPEINKPTPTNTCKKAKPQRKLRSSQTTKENTPAKEEVSPTPIVESKADDGQLAPIKTEDSNTGTSVSPNLTKDVHHAEIKNEKKPKGGKLGQVKPDITGTEITSHAVVMVEKLPSDKIPEKIRRQHLCGYCGKSFKFRHRLEKHTFSAHTRIRPYKCSHNKCELTFASKKEWNNHVRDHALAVEQGKDIVQNINFKGYLCTKCKTRFPRPEEWDSHDPTCKATAPTAPIEGSLVNKEDKRQNIDEDNFFDTLAEVSKLIKIKDVECYGEKDGKFVCDKCGKIYVNRYAIERHLYGVHDHPRPYFCGKCEQPFSTRAECARHLQDHDLAERKGSAAVVNHHFQGYLCMRCLQRFDLPTKLDDHKKICKTEPIVCKHCGKQYKKQCVLKKHITDVHAEKNEKCPECNKMVSNLNAHKRVHTSKKYTCLTCEKVFNRADNLRVHERIHTGDKPFHCTQCDEHFRLKCLLKSHLKRHRAPIAEEVRTTVYNLHEEFTAPSVINHAPPVMNPPPLRMIHPPPGMNHPPQGMNLTVPQNMSAQYRMPQTQFTQMSSVQQPNMQFAYAAPMQLEGEMPIEHFIGQPQAQEVVLEENAQSLMVAGNANMSGVPQPSTYLTL